MNAQGDVIALLDENYNIVVKYTYDTWGKVLSVTNLVSSIITEVIEGEFTWKDGVQIAVSTVIGGAEGALSALAPGAAPLISAGAGFLETAINGAIEGKDSTGIIIRDSVITGFFSAAGTIGGIDFIKGGELVNKLFNKYCKDYLVETLQTAGNSIFSGAAFDTILNVFMKLAT